MNNRIFFSTIFGFLIGIFLASIFSLTPSFVYLFGVLGIASLSVTFVYSNPRKTLLTLAIVSIFISAGILRFYIKDSTEPKHKLDNFIEEEVAIEGLIKREVDVREGSQRVYLLAEEISLRGEKYDIDQAILVSTELYPTLDYGDRVFVSGELKIPENFETDIGKTFDYISYLKKDSIFYILPFAHVEVTSSGEGSSILSAILSLKQKFLNSIGSVIPAPESALLGGLLLGVKQSLGENLQQAFIDVGLVHIIVLSGYNVTIIAEALIKVLSFLSVSAGIYFGSFAIVVFAIMTGAGATIVRASIMAILALVARATGRNSDITRALLLAATIMVIHNPYILVFDISFQLSFLATLGLIYVSPVFSKWFKFIPERFGLREVAAATIGVQVFVLPFILYKMGNLSIVAPITNILILPLVPVTMLFGFVSGLFALLSPIIATPFGWIAYVFLKLEIFIVETFSGLSFASIKITHFPLILVLSFYIFALYYLWRYYKKYESF